MFERGSGGRVAPRKVFRSSSSPLEVVKGKARVAARGGAVGSRNTSGATSPVKQTNNPSSVFTPIAEAQKETTVTMTPEQFQQEQAKTRVDAVKNMLVQRQEYLSQRVQENKIRNAPEGSTFTSGSVDVDGIMLPVNVSRDQAVNQIQQNKKNILSNKGINEYVVHQPVIQVSPYQTVTKTTKGDKVSYGFSEIDYTEWARNEFYKDNTSEYESYKRGQVGIGSNPLSFEQKRDVVYANINAAVSPEFWQEQLFGQHKGVDVVNKYLYESQTSEKGLGYELSRPFVSNVAIPYFTMMAGGAFIGLLSKVVPAAGTIAKIGLGVTGVGLVGASTIPPAIIGMQTGQWVNLQRNVIGIGIQAPFAGLGFSEGYGAVSRMNIPTYSTRGTATLDKIITPAKTVLNRYNPKNIWNDIRNPEFIKAEAYANKLETEGILDMRTTLNPVIRGNHRVWGFEAKTVDMNIIRIRASTPITPWGARFRDILYEFKTGEKITEPTPTRSSLITHELSHLNLDRMGGTLDKVGMDVHETIALMAERDITKFPNMNYNKNLVSSIDVKSSYEINPLNVPEGNRAIINVESIAYKSGTNKILSGTRTEAVGSVNSLSGDIDLAVIKSTKIESFSNKGVLIGSDVNPNVFTYNLAFKNMRTQGIPLISETYGISDTSGFLLRGAGEVGKNPMKNMFTKIGGNKEFKLFDTTSSKEVYPEFFKGEVHQYSINAGKVSLKPGLISVREIGRVEVKNIASGGGGKVSGGVSFGMDVPVSNSFMRQDILSSYVRSVQGINLGSISVSLRSSSSATGYLPGLVSLSRSVQISVPSVKTELSSQGAVQKQFNVYVPKQVNVNRFEQSTIPREEVIVVPKQINVQRQVNIPTQGFIPRYDQIQVPIQEQTQIQLQNQIQEQVQIQDVLSRQVTVNVNTYVPKVPFIGFPSMNYGGGGGGDYSNPININYLKLKKVHPVKLVFGGIGGGFKL